jgi:hypothetical protein
MPGAHDAAGIDEVGTMTHEELRAEIESRLQYVGTSQRPSDNSRQDPVKRAAETWTLEGIYRRLGLNG